MPQPARRTIADKVLIQHTEADVDIGFGLVDSAKAYHHSGLPELSSRVLQNAMDIVVEIEVRLQRLGDLESAPFRPLLTELRKEIAAMEEKMS